MFEKPSKFRTLLILGRVSNLPTVWSNCVAAWWLGGGGPRWQAVVVAVSMSFLYVGGMFLNDAFDADFDREHRKSRPIPSGAISEAEVWQWGFAWLILGASGLLWMGETTALLTLALIGGIVLYDALHKMVGVAPVLMGGCRWFVYLVAASATVRGVTGDAVWFGLALAAYVMGLSCLARKESTRLQVRSWPTVFLFAPVVLAAFVDDSGENWVPSLILVLWILWALRQTFWRQERNIGYTVSRLLAGIALVDMLAVGELADPLTGLFAGCFVLALLLQRFIPAT